MGRDFLPAFLGAVPVSVSVWSTRLCLMFQLPGLVSVLVLVWSTRPGEQPGGTPQIRNLPISSSHLGLPRSPVSTARADFRGRPPWLAAQLFADAHD